MSDDQTEKEGTSCCCGGSCGGGAGRWIWIVLALAVAGVLLVKHAGKKGAAPSPAVAVVESVGTNAVAQAKALPRLVDLGAGKCIPCKMMAPILEELRTNLAGRVEVQFIDVWENEEAGKQYGIEMIPTQIFYDAQGKELFRHEGFMGKEDILAKWKALGVVLETKPE